MAGDTLVLVLTLRCNARCAHCFEGEVGTATGPTGDTDMPLERALRYVREFAEASAGDFKVGLTGGECLLREDDVVAVCSLADELGAGRVAVTTNGFWATDEARARSVARRLREAGLTTVGISVDHYHQEFVPLALVRTAIRACLDAGIAVGVKCVISEPGDLPNALAGIEDLLVGQMVTLEAIPLARLGRGRELDGAHVPVDPDHWKSACDAGLLTIWPDGRVMPCCGFVSHDDLALGDVERDGIPELRTRIMRRTLYRTLRTKGPSAFVRYLPEGYADGLVQSWVDPCSVCEDLFATRASCAAVRRGLADMRSERSALLLGLER